MQVNIFLSPWSSGSTAITGYMDRLGTFTCPPHVTTNDERTPNSHEPVELQKQLLQNFDELSLQPKTQDHTLQFQNFFIPWLDKKREAAADLGANSITIKQPLLAFYVEQLINCGDFHYFIIQRPLDQIEATRVRRKWAANYGIAGAQTIYNACFNMLIKHSIPAEVIPFEKFKMDGKYRNQLISRMGITLDSGLLCEAENWLRT